MSNDAVATSPTPPSGGGFLQKLFGLYLSATETFRGILARPTFWLPLVGLMVLNLAFTVVWTQKVDPTEFMRNQNEESGALDRVPPERQASMLETQAKMFPIFAWLGPVFILVGVAIMAAILLFVFRFFLSSTTTFRDSMTVVAWAFLAVSVVTTPLILIIMALKGDWNINPQTALMTNLAALLDRTDTPKPLYVLAQSLDLVSFWMMYLLSVGYAVATRRTTGAAAAGVVGAWVVFVLIKVGWAAIF